ncbi:MAG: ABC transporter permease [Neomegalonema sp.]|nr:ABC transporter permease [Neomegalonema sp.]
MKSTSSFILSAYIGLFLVFMFAPLILMVVASFNDISPPSVTEWRGFTWKWYAFFWTDAATLRADPVLRALDRDKFVGCLQNSLIIAGVVTPAALVFGLSGAIILTRWQSRLNGLLWWILLSPILAPGVILGLSALVFWSSLGVDAGLFTIIIAMTTYVSGFSMLIIMARLQRQPVEQEEAALDLGAGPMRVFRRVTLPFLTPALLSAAVITFMAVIENFNTTMFSKGGACTFATEIGSMVRNPNGHPPVINAVGAIVILLTIIAATVHAFARRAEKRR